jgi:hypothetical protein
MSVIDLTEDTVNCISTTITKEINESIDTCKVEVPYNFTITIGDELNVYDKSSTLLFKGLVQSIKTSGIKEVTAYDYGVQLMDINVNEIYEEQKAEDIIEDIVNDTDLTYVSTITTSSTISNYIIKDKRGWDVVTELAELLNAQFRVDKNKNFYLELIEEDSSTETITTDNAVIDDDWSEDADQLVNKVILIGDKQEFEKTETFNGDGTTSEFVLSEFPISVNVTVGGTEQTGFVEGASATADYKVPKGTKTVKFESGSIPGSGTDNVVVKYIFSIDIKITSQDINSLNTYGVKEKKIVKSYINSFAEARRYVKYYLDIFSKPLQTSKWIINDYSKFEDFIPNQLISVNDTIRNISGNFIIRKVEREFPGRLNVEIGMRENDILDWNKETQYRIKQLEERDDNSTILQEYELLENKVNIKVTTSVNRQLYRDLPDNYMYLGDANDTPVYANIGDGTERPLKDENEDPPATEFFITDQSYWNVPDAELAEHGHYVSWIDIADIDELLITEGNDSIIFQDGSIFSTE